MAIYVYNNTSSVYAQNRRASAFTSEQAARLSIVERTSFETHPDSGGAKHGQAYEPKPAVRADLERAARNLSISRANRVASESKIRDMESANVLALEAGHRILTEAGAADAHKSDSLPQRALRLLL